MSAPRARPYTDIATLVLAAGGPHGLDGVPVAELVPRSLSKAVAELRRLGRDELADALAKSKHCAARPSGSRLPSLGEVRRYNVQTADGLDYVRPPTAPIGSRRGGTVDAHFVESGVAVAIGDDFARTGPAIVIFPGPDKESE